MSFRVFVLNYKAKNILNVIVCFLFFGPVKTDVKMNRNICDTLTAMTDIGLTTQHQVHVFEVINLASIITAQPLFTFTAWFSTFRVHTLFKSTLRLQFYFL